MRVKVLLKQENGLSRMIKESRGYLYTLSDLVGAKAVGEGEP